MKIFIASLASAFFLCASQSFAQQIIVNTGGSVNCVNAPGENGFEISNYSLGGTDPSRPAGTGTRKPNLSNLNIVKGFDTCSEQLIQAFLGAKSLPTVTLTQYSAGVGKSLPPFPFLTITLTNALISNYQLAGQNPAAPQEQVSFAYTAVCVSSTAQTPSGAPSETTKVCYDAVLNKIM